MTLESQLIQKTYYEMFINKHEDEHPVSVLGELYYQEQKKDVPDLSYIRFAQGEVYFHNKDFEAAVFKWGNITNELEPWAKKNTADAYYELGLLSMAEDIYKSIVTENSTLETEVALQLFSLYIERSKIDAAVTVLKKMVASNPDYPNVTEIAKAFFEEQQDWVNAVELAVNEAVRTESLQWFDSLKAYVESGLTKFHSPEFFSEAVTALYTLDQKRFEGLVLALWNSYKSESSYFTWLKEMNHILEGLDIDRNHSWPELSRIFKETYFDLIDGKYLIYKIQDLIPPLLKNWIRLTDTAQAVLASTAILSWSELFPASIQSTAFSEAEALFSQSEKNVNEMDECLRLFDAIMEWAGQHDMGDNLRLKWIAEQLIDYKTHHFFITGLNGSGKSSFINFILGDQIIHESPTSSVVVFKNDQELSIDEINDREISSIPTISEFQERLERRRNALDSLLEFKQPNKFLSENHLAFIDTPGLNAVHFESGEVFKYLPAADAVLFVLDAKEAFSEQERTILSKIQQLVPETPIHFLLNKMDTVNNEQEAVNLYEEVRTSINSYLPDAKVFAFSTEYDRNQQLRDLNDFIRSIELKKHIQDKRLAKLLLFIRSTITLLLQKRIDVENQLVESVRWNEEIVTKLQGAVNQLSDLEAQKTTVMKRTYGSIKDSIQKEMAEAIPKILRECSKLINENSNFSKIHLELNDEMNRRLQDYLENTILPKYYRSLQEWIVNATGEFEQGQAFLDEMGEGFNTLYGEERIQLNCDFKVLDDWRRDTDRMTSRFQLENVNILLRRTPSQLLLKSAGKLFGALSQNKTMLHNRYMQFVESEDYSETVVMVSKQLFQQFELFEKSLARDVNLFFRNPGIVLNKAVEDARSEIQNSQEMLNKMNTNPEMYRDPLTLFEVKLRQFEWMTVSGKGTQAINL